MRLRMSALPRARLRGSILRANCLDNENGLSDYPIHYISFDTRLCFRPKKTQKVYTTCHDSITEGIELLSNHDLGWRR
jgi:hypothetical protein